MNLLTETIEELSPLGDIVAATKGGKCASTMARGHLVGSVVHAVVGPVANGFWGTPALCKASPSDLGFGWLTTSQEVSCPKCLTQLTEYRIAKAVWDGEIDGWDTRTVSDHFEIGTAKALRILKKIVGGNNTDFAFVYEPSWEGVTVSDGRVFVWSESGDWEEGHGLRHRNWFYT